MFDGDAGQDPSPWTEQLDVGHLLRAARRLHSAIKDHPTPGILTPTQFVVLLALCRLPSIDQRTVSELASIDQATVSETVRRLQHKGLVQVDRDPGDGRRRLLSPAGEAASLVRADSARLRIADREILARLSPQEQEDLIHDMTAIAYADRVDPVTRSQGEGSRSTSGAVFSVAETSRAFGRLLRICAQLHTSIWGAEIGSLVTPPQYSLLCLIRSSGRLSQGEIGGQLYLDKVTVAGLLARMQQRSLIHVARDTRDGRQRVITLADYGSNVVRLVEPAAQEVENHLLRPVGARRSQLLPLLRSIVSNPEAVVAALPTAHSSNVQ